MGTTLSAATADLRLVQLAKPLLEVTMGHELHYTHDKSACLSAPKA